MFKRTYTFEMKLLGTQLEDPGGNFGQSNERHRGQYDDSKREPRGEEGRGGENDNEMTKITARVFVCVRVIIN